MPTIPPERAHPSEHEPHHHRQVAESFGTDPDRYDRARPRYPDALVDQVVAASPGPGVLPEAEHRRMRAQRGLIDPAPLDQIKPQPGHAVPHPREIHTAPQRLGQLDSRPREPIRRRHRAPHRYRSTSISATGTSARPSQYARPT